MTLESEIFAALKSLAADRVYVHPAPQDVTQLPRITYQHVGGTPINFLEGSPTTKDRYRIQVNGWHNNKEEALALGRAIKNALQSYTALQPHVLTGMIYIYEEDTKLYGTMQDFGLFG